MRRMTFYRKGKIMLNFLSKYRKILVWVVMVFCLAALLCPVNAQAAGKLDVTVKSPTNPDYIFTLEEEYDLTVCFQGGANETYYLSYKVVDSRKLALAQTREPIAVTLSAEGYGELLLNLNSIKGRDTFRVDITITDASGATVVETSQSFSRVATDSVASEIANVRDGVRFSTDLSLPNRYLYLKKTDRVEETFTVTYRITDNDANILRQAKGTVTLNGNDYLTVPINLYGLEQHEQCRIAYTVFDDSGNLRASGISYYQHNGGEYIEGKLYSAENKVGLIYANNAPYDLVLTLRKTDNYAESFSMRYTVTDTYGAVVYEFSDTLDLPEQEAVKIPLALPEVTGYGIFTLTVTTTDQFGHEKAQSFQFSRVLSTAEPGALPLVNINDHFTTGKGEPEPKLELSAQAGFGMWRCSIPWVSVERSPGNYSMPASVEQVMKKTEALGMEAFVILAYGNDTLYGLPDPTKEGWLEAYANYCKYIASYFGDRVTYYEIWNEWNHTSMGKTDPNRRSGNYYAMALAAASKAIKSVNPNAKIIGGAMAGHNEDWMVAMLNYDGNGDGKSDAMEAMDGFSFHTYATDWSTCFYSFTEHNYARDFQEVIDVLNRYGDASTKEIWMTETGWSTCIGPGVTEEVQASYMVQMYTWALANPDMVDRIFWYDLMNDADAHTLKSDPTAGEHNWGLIHNWNNSGDEPLAYSAKKSYVAACAMNSMLAGAQNGVAYDLGDGVYAYKFQKDGQDLVVAWMDNATKTLNVTIDGELVVTDLYGNATTHTGTAQLNLSNCPIYIQGNFTIN